MIKRVVKGKEIFVGVNNEVGVLAKLTSFLVNHGINIEAVLGYATEPGEHAGVMFIASNNTSAIESLGEHGYETIREDDVLIVEVENRPGALKNISECCAGNGINITYFYCTTCSGGCPAKLVLSTSDNDKALAVLTAK
jgi:hypothetical protein